MHIYNNIRVAVYVLQILTFLTLISAQSSSSVSPAVLTKINLTNNATTASYKTPYKPPAPSINEEIVGAAESGAKIEIQVKPSVNVSQLHNREHAVNEPFIANTSTILASSVSPISSTSPKIKIHINSSISSTTSSTERSIPVYEDKHLIQNKTENPDHKKISARKGVNFTDDLEPKQKHKKPPITLAGDEPLAPSNFQSKSNSSASPKVPNLDMISESNQGKTQKYVVPIVIVILSVPFVAILISVLYKRGAEWWKYRHYSRMDFLINGMYDN